MPRVTLSRQERTHPLMWRNRFDWVRITAAIFISVCCMTGQAENPTCVLLSSEVSQRARNSCMQLTADQLNCVHVSCFHRSRSHRNGCANRNCKYSCSGLDSQSDCSTDTVTLTTRRSLASIACCVTPSWGKTYEFRQKEPLWETGIQCFRGGVCV